MMVGAMALSSPDLAFFGYAWGVGGYLDSYMQETVNAYLDLGLNVDVYLANYFSADGATSGFKDDFLLDRLVRYIRERDYIAAISINNALVMEDVVEALEGRLTSIIVDDFNHLFCHEADRFAAFRLPAHFAPIGSQFERAILSAIPDAANRVCFLTPATAGMHVRRSEIPSIYPISWIASMTTDDWAEGIMLRLLSDPRAHEIVGICLLAIEQTGNLTNILQTFGHAILPVVNSLGIEIQVFEMLLQNVRTSRDRMEVVRRLSPHGLALFGNSAWAKGMLLSDNVYKSFKPGAPIRTHQDLLNIYNSSKLAINQPQASITESFQYRLLDVMSSNALLVTRRTPEPDLYRVFGPDCPVVMFDDAEDLEKVCIYYLTHEDERAARVAACNSLVGEEFSFRSRALDYLRLAGVNFTQPNLPSRGRMQLLTNEIFA
ncbi:glycosyltransferase [Methylobacterium brachythecii]|uniref:Spore protein YkvP/CgeB glycosyl transferase-like domain-containing protein n=1 Tax=Methylobacterium brachythecii TaxID=1176177 RepID=A0A7W6F9J5_9HYPH|nr:glycosyltransferase [Methylobacterium brachythecii]MBB3905585.1 hypothetical protein [Methylobacterium brachythecii]GLS46574.1 hypothetical protein GCM10007884_45680 [Methylobacterium brachythecii]